MDFNEKLQEIKKGIVNLDAAKSELVKKSFELGNLIKEKELSIKKYSEQDLYDFAMHIIYPKYRGSKRIDIICEWARNDVEEFKKSKLNNDQ